MFKVSTLKLVQNESLSHRVNFGVGYNFSKGPGSAFSESPGPGLGPLYKVCHLLRAFWKGLFWKRFEDIFKKHFLVFGQNTWKKPVLFLSEPVVFSIKSNFVTVTFPVNCVNRQVILSQLIGYMGWSNADVVLLY